MLGWVQFSKGNWVEAGSAYSNAIELPTETLYTPELIAVYYQTIGYIKKAHELLEEILQNDPLNRTAHGHYMLSLAYLGDNRRAEAEYEFGKALFGDRWSLSDSFITNIRLGSKEIMSRDKVVYSDPITDALKAHIDSPKEGLAELRRLYGNDSSDFCEISLWAAYFGDPEFAMDSMEKLFIKKEYSSFFWFWLPVMKEVRQLPRFKKYMKEIGLVDYWNEFGWPDICRPLDNGDFVCD